MTKDINVNVARDFSRFPAGRYRADGRFSGEAFREEFLVPRLQDCDHVTVELDGALGYGSSFLEEAFGGLRRAGFPVDDLHRKLRLVSSDHSLLSEIQSYLRGG
ncbi:STAS-like domain-containing protein [Pinirhizobacter sp.]|jgi:hypothetical protein|uniref:STAS-like domain-containing protein n=1 Tax=Pinirhizobacter sp. TaxID=2950432 RepID=UPI002F3E39BB